jgi:ParB family chromosome partitioning protein
MVPLEQIQAATKQPRTHFDSTRLDELAQSIKREGLIQPIVLRLMDENEYTIIAGERRYRAAHRAGLHEIPAIIKETTAAQAFEWAVIENIQREDLNPIEEAQAYQLLKESTQCSQEDLANRLGKSRVTIANSLRLLKLSGAIQQFLETGELSAGHARALLMAPKQVQLSLARRAVDESWTVRKTEEEAKRLHEADTAPADVSPAKTPRRNEAVEAQLRAAIGAPVRVVQKRGKGRIEVRFHSFEELERLIDIFSTVHDG